MGERTSSEAREAVESERQDWIMVDEFERVISGAYIAGLEREIKGNYEKRNMLPLSTGVKSFNDIDRSIRELREKQVEAFFALHGIDPSSVMHLGKYWAFNMGDPPVGIGLELSGENRPRALVHVLDEPVHRDQFEDLLSTIASDLEKNPFVGKKEVRATGDDSSLVLVSAIQIGLKDAKDTRFFIKDEADNAFADIVAIDAHTFVVLRGEEETSVVRLGIQ